MFKTSSRGWYYVNFSSFKEIRSFKLFLMSQWLDGVHRDEEIFCGYYIDEDRSFSVTWIKNTANVIWQLLINKPPHCMPFKTGLFGVCKKKNFTSENLSEYFWSWPKAYVARIFQGRLHETITNSPSGNKRNVSSNYMISTVYKPGILVPNREPFVDRSNWTTPKFSNVARPEVTSGCSLGLNVKQQGAPP